MADHAQSDDPAVQAQLDRFAQLSPGRDILGLERITQLLSVLGNPHKNLPPVFHVAGTNGKGSTCAFLRALVEASGMSCHVYTSPHLVRFNERIRVAGKLIPDDMLAARLAEVLDASEAHNIGPSFFEATTAAAFLAFSRIPADVAIIEVGLGGRLDATNIIEKPTICGIAQLGVDHEAFLLADEPGLPAFEQPIHRIAYEKSGIAKAETPLVVQSNDTALLNVIATHAEQRSAKLIQRSNHWDFVAYEGRLHYRDGEGKLVLPLPRMAGPHQIQNAALAIAMARHSGIGFPETAYKAAMGWAYWPGRLQLLNAGPLSNLAPQAQVWVDGAHNPAAAQQVAEYFKDTLQGVPLHIITGILANKDATGVLAPFEGIAKTLTALPVPGHEHHTPESVANMAQNLGMSASTAPNITRALARSTASNILIMGSLYLAGEVLKANGQVLD
jgi:dihydrofolate synthase / folylpolyglutamate synthase